MSLYACSDIHGQYDLFIRLLDKINFSDEDTLYILGDMVDRGPKSIEMIDCVMSRDNIVCLLGNHELMIHDHYRGGWEANDCWLLSCNGGKVTKKAFSKLPEVRREAVLDWIDSLYLQVKVETGGTSFLLSHSAYLKDRADVKWQEVDYRTAFNAVWDSPWREWEYFPIERYAEDGATHVIGHVPVQRMRAWYEGSGAPGPHPLFDEENRVINIDMGCASVEAPDPFPYAGICCLDLTKWAAGDKDDAFIYVVA